MSVRSSLHQHIVQVWEQTVADVTVPSNFVVSRPENWQFGDYTTNIAMVGFATLDPTHKATWKSPRALAELMCETARHLFPTFTFTVAGPGFINIVLENSQLVTQVITAITDTDQLIPATKFAGKEVVVEFTDPNPFKEFHIGHLYSNIVGESISRLLSKGGATVHRVCYQGDVGMHVAKSVWGLQTKLANDNLTITDLGNRPLPDRIKYLGQAYALGASAYEDDPAAATQIKDINYLIFIFGQENLMASMNWTPQVDYRSKLSDSTTETDTIRELYQLGRTWSLDYFETIYRRLGTTFEDYFFESLVGELGLQLVKEAQKNHVFVESQGAVIYPGSQKKLHDRVFINSQGLPTYEAKELGLAPEKYRRFHYDWSIIVTGNEIVEYFRVLISALTDINPELAQKTIHMSHGMVRLPSGKMSSRTGKILTGEWLLDEAKTSVLPLLSDTTNPHKLDLTATEIETIAEQIGQAAIKFALLSSRLGKDIAFDFQSSLSFSGFSGPYLQYTATRCKSLKQKATAAGITIPATIPTDITIGETERLVLLELSRWPEVLGQTISELAPHILAEYLFALAQVFNSFYAAEPILQSAMAPKRLTLVAAVEQVLTEGLWLLGITVPEKM